jgi:Alpha-L-arabinofuranosidase B, catalytic/Polysaccharide lyase
MSTRPWLFGTAIACLAAASLVQASGSAAQVPKREPASSAPGGANVGTAPAARRTAPPVRLDPPTPSVPTTGRVPLPGVDKLDTPFAKPLDSRVAVAAYSFRKLRSGFSGNAVRIRRASDGANRDIGFTGAGNFAVSDATTFCGGTVCTITTFFDQSGAANNLAQPAIEKQPSLDFTNLGLPIARWCSTCGMKAADSAAYKTAVVHAFMVVKLGLPAPLTSPSAMIVGYPRTTTSGIADFSWGVSNQGHADIFLFQIYRAGAGYQDGSENPEGFGAVYRDRLFQYDFGTENRTIKYNSNLFSTGADAAVEYGPEAVGLHVGMDAEGKSNLANGEFGELMLFSSTQTDRDVLSRSQSKYWQIADPPSAIATGDAFAWNPIFTGNFGSSGGPNRAKPLEVNGNRYYSESAWASHSLWQSNNVKGGVDLFRFEVRRGDVDNLGGNERSELDGAAGPSWPVDSTTQISYSVMVEPGPPVTNADWQILGQFHYDDAVYPPTSFAFGLRNDVWTVEKDNVNPTPVYTSPVITRGKWYDMFVEQRISLSGTADVLKVWIDGTPVVNLSGKLFPHGKQGGYWKYGVYRGNTVNETIAVQYANMAVTNKASTDLSARILTPLPHPVPLPVE